MTKVEIHCGVVAVAAWIARGFVRRFMLAMAMVIAGCVYRTTYCDWVLAAGL